MSPRWVFFFLHLFQVMPSGRDNGSRSCFLDLEGSRCSINTTQCDLIARWLLDVFFTEIRVLLGFFQLSWQIFGSSSLIQRRAAFKNLVAF